MGGGLAEGVRPVAMHLEGRSAYALLAWGLTHRTWPDRTIASTARRYVRDMRAVQPHGPYFVGGRSSGGIVAFEMACQLRSAGHEVLPVVLFDTGGPESPRRKRFGYRLRTRLDEMRRQQPSRSRRIVGAARIVARTLAGEVIAAYYGNTAGIVRRDLTGQRWAFRCSRHAMLRRYRPDAYDGTVLLLRAEVPPRNLDHRWDRHDLGWGPYVRGALTIVDVTGTHSTLADEPHAAATAAAIERVVAPIERKLRS
jgi:thioesterase domain-containing protein